MLYRSLPVYWLLPLLLCFDLPGQTFERKFVWKNELKEYSYASYNDSNYYYHRLSQTYYESGFKPNATSDFAGWKRAKLDTATAIVLGKGAAGLCQFIWQTAIRYGAKTIQTEAAYQKQFQSDIYNPYWSLSSMCRYMKNIERILLKTINIKARRALMVDRKFKELCATASYNTGEGRIRNRLNKYGYNWNIIRTSILPEPRNYAERIWKLAKVEGSKL